MLALDSQPLDRLELLTRINLDDLVAAFGLADRPRLAQALRALCKQPARKFAAQMLRFDAAIADAGLPRAALELQAQHVQALHVSGDERVPREGPLLVVANHPSMTDSLCLFSALGRKDLKVIALRTP